MGKTAHKSKNRSERGDCHSCLRSMKHLYNFSKEKNTFSYISHTSAHRPTKGKLKLHEIYKKKTVTSNKTTYSQRDNQFRGCCLKRQRYDKDSSTQYTECRINTSLSQVHCFMNNNCRRPCYHIPSIHTQRIWICIHSTFSVINLYQQFAMTCGSGLDANLSMWLPGLPTLASAFCYHC